MSTTAQDMQGWREIVNEAALLIPATGLRESAIIGGIARIYRSVGHAFPQRSLVVHSVEEYFNLDGWKKINQTAEVLSPKVAEALTPLPTEEEITLWREAFSNALAIVRKRREAGA